MTMRISLFALLCVLLPAAGSTLSAAQNLGQSQNVQMAALQPHLVLERTSPTQEHPDGPVLYQLLFSTGGTPGTLAKFDTNPRHLTNSLITDNGAQVAIGSLSIASTGIMTFANGQTFPGAGNGTVTSVGLAAPLSDFSISGSPVTSSGLLTLNWNTAPSSTNTGNAIVKRDGNGNFSAGAINASTISVANSNVGVVLQARSLATSGFATGIYGESNSPVGIAGSFANNNASGKILALLGPGSAEVFDVFSSGAVVASNNTTSNTITATNSNASGTGVNASGGFLGMYASSGTGFSVGISGNAGIWGDGRTDAKYGVYGTSINNFGVAGRSQTGTGAFGQSQDGAGIVGLSSGAGTAGIFNATGTGKILSAQKTGVEKFSVANDGTVRVAGNNLNLLMGDPGCNSGFAGIGFAGLSGCSNFTLVGDGVGNTYLNSSGGNTLHFRSNNVDRMTIDDPGNVNITNLVGTNIFSISATGTVTIPFGLNVGGSVNIAGNLSKGSGSFKIDHPLDPANKYLYHSFVESPDMMDIYNGNVTTNARGMATITLPEYFEALNRDFRYQLTVIGQFAQAIVARKISKNRFTIRTSKPNVEVSWQVTGIRQDAYANAHRISVEEDKGEQRGTYLHPELFQQPLSKQVSQQASHVGTKSAGE
jgi:hypothetical protein